MLGYLHTVRGAPLAQLGLRSLLPSAGREGVSVLMEYQHWRQQQRGVAPRSSVMPVKATICLARWLYHDQSEVRCVAVAEAGPVVCSGSCCRACT
jgi:hypothetical protein